MLYVNNLLYLHWYLLNHELDVVVPPICLWDLELDWLSYITVGVFSLTPISSPLMDNPHILLLFGEEVSRPLLITDK